MRLAVFLVFILTTLVSKADEKNAVSPEEARLYSAYVGALAMKDHCNIKSQHREGDFELALNAIGKSFIKKGMSAESLKKLTEDSKAIALQKPFSECGADTKAIIVDSFNKSWVWAMEVAQQKE